ncbi:hypothetical protein FB451DRAFT_1414727 [Mycena latifolia]|nr:hypothetical protein FB451DRAFT_1414727 [Mycena latifolia]
MSADSVSCQLVFPPSRRHPSFLSRGRWILDALLGSVSCSRVICDLVVLAILDLNLRPQTRPRHPGSGSWWQARGASRTAGGPVDLRWSARHINTDFKIHQPPSSSAALASPDSEQIRAAHGDEYNTAVLLVDTSFGAKR